MSDKLVIFDVDGTLCDTCEVDDECFKQVAGRIFGIGVSGMEWQSSPHVTDSGIVNWLWQTYRGCLPTKTEYDDFVSGFISRLAMEVRRVPERFEAMTGVKAALERLSELEWGVAFSTGGWRKSAEIKLLAAGLPAERLLSSSDDSYDRVTVFSLAQSRSAEKDGVEYSRTVLVGDGIWDVQVARVKEWPFVGVGNDAKSEKLLQAGALSVIRDFSKVSEFMEMLDVCNVPKNCGWLTTS